MRAEFLEAIAEKQLAFGLELDAAAQARLADYYEIVLEHNPLLHLVAPCSPEEFATRHILESVTLLQHLPNAAKLADVGSGGGLPAIPCLLVREDLKAILIESKEKKAAFLRTAIERLGLSERASVVNRQFDETGPADSDHIVCRALDKFEQKLPRLLKWSGERKKLFFGGNSLGAVFEERKIEFEQHLMPLSEQRFLFVLG